MASNAETAYKDLVASGLKPGAAVGVVGNLIAESGVNPGARGDGGLAYGIAQWHPDRQANLRRYAAAHGGNPASLDTQIGFLIAEAKQTGVWGHLQNVTDPVTASGIWMRQFERPADQSQANAVRRAQLGIKALAGKSSAGGRSFLDQLESAAGGVGDFITGGAIKWPGGMVRGIEDLGSAAKSAGSLFDHLLWWFNPGNVLRVIIGASGLVLIIVGILLLSREART